MKSFLILGLVLAVSATLVAGPVLAAKDDKPGAVKVDLVCAEAGTVVGWAIADANAKGDGMINLQIHVDDLLANETYDVKAGPKDADCDDDDMQLLGELTTNEQGNGNAHFQGAPEDPPTGDSLTFKVCVDGCSAELTVQLK